MRTVTNRLRDQKVGVYRLVQAAPDLQAWSMGTSGHLAAFTRFAASNSASEHVNVPLGMHRSATSNHTRSGAGVVYSELRRWP